MYVTRLDADDWTADAQHDEVIENPEAKQIEDALTLLDGERHTLAVLGADEGAYMGIGGGAGGKYVVFINYNDEEFYSLQDPDPTIPEDADISLTIGGRQDEYPARQCVSREVMLLAARQFAADGSREPSLTWVLQEEDDEDEEWVVEGPADEEDV